METFEKIFYGNKAKIFLNRKRFTHKNQPFTQEIPPFTHFFSI
jgi:hypothetical protein